MQNALLLQHRGKVADAQVKGWLLAKLKIPYLILKPRDVVIEVGDEWLRVNALAILPDADMQMRTGGFARVARNGHNGTSRDDVALIDQNRAQVSV